MTPHVTRRAAALALSLASSCAAAAPHHPNRPPQPSTLPPPHLAGEPATRLGHRYTGTPIDVTTYHYDNNRTGWNPTETDLTPASVASAQFGLLTSLAVDGNVLAQPLLVSGYVLPDGTTHDVLIIATGHNSVYAFDARSYAKLWHVNLGRSQSSADVGCGDVQPEYGISSTPVIVRSAANAATLYVVAATEPKSGQFVSTLHALDLGTGTDAMPAATIAPAATLNDGTQVQFDPQNQWNRTGLAWNNGALYIGVGSHCDNNSGTITGWLLNYSATLQPQAAFHTINTSGGTELASIWMTGFAPAIDPQGNVFVVTGNGDTARLQKDWGESALKLNPALSAVTSSFTTTSFHKFNNRDEDFGSGGIMLLPPVTGQTAPPLAIAIGKAGDLYLLNQSKLGGLSKNDAGALQKLAGFTGGVWGGPAYWNGATGPAVLVQGDSDVLHSLSLAPSSTPSLTPTAAGTSAAGYGGSLPIVSSNGATPHTGVVWLINRAQEPFAIEAYDAEQLGAPIFTAQIGMWSNASNGNPFLTPLQANGRVYAPGYQVVQVYGLTGG